MYLFWQRGLQNGESFTNTLHNFLCRFGVVKAPDHDLSDPGLLWGQTAQHVLQPIPLAAQLTQCRVKAAGLTQCRVKAVEYRFSCACVCVKYLVFLCKCGCVCARKYAHTCVHVMRKWKTAVQFFLFKNSFSRAFVLVLCHTPSWKSELKVVKYYPICGRFPHPTHQEIFLEWRSSCRMENPISVAPLLFQLFSHFITTSFSAMYQDVH